MAYTETDLANIENAISELASGRRVASIAVNGKTTEFGRAQLPELQALRSDIQAEVQTAAGRKRFLLTQTSKGL